MEADAESVPARTTKQGLTRVHPELARWGRRLKVQLAAHVECAGDHFSEPPRDLGPPLGYFEGNLFLRRAVDDFRAEVAAASVAWMDLVADPERDGETSVARIVLAAERLLAWEERVAAATCRGQHRRLLLQLRGLGRMYVLRLGALPQRLLRGVDDDGDLSRSGLEFPAWIDHADLGMRARDVFLRVVATTLTLLIVSIVTYFIVRA